jgi:long-subunit acyl-CoA synthetase (AMP-forming)
VLLVENAAQWKKVEQVLGDLPAAQGGVHGWRRSRARQGAVVMRWLGDGVSATLARAHRRARAGWPFASLIYTSGTTGRPRA